MEISCFQSARTKTSPRFCPKSCYSSILFAGISLVPFSMEPSRLPSILKEVSATCGISYGFVAADVVIPQRPCGARGNTKSHVCRGFCHVLFWDFFLLLLLFGFGAIFFFFFFILLQMSSYLGARIICPGNPNSSFNFFALRPLVWI